MKHLAIVLALAALGGCATYQPAPAYYGTRAYAQPGEWQTVSVTPVPLGTGAAVAGNTTVTTMSGTSSAGVPTYLPPPGSGTTIVQQPIYSAPPVYVAPAAPVYVAPDPWYWWPPISIGLGFSWSHWSGGHGGHGGWHGGHGGWNGGHGGWRGGGRHR